SIRIWPELCRIQLLEFATRQARGEKGRERRCVRRCRELQRRCDRRSGPVIPASAIWDQFPAGPRTERVQASAAVPAREEDSSIRIDKRGPHILEQCNKVLDRRHVPVRCLGWRRFFG